MTSRTEANLIRTLSTSLNPIEALAQCISVDELSRDETRNAGGADLMDCEAVRMIQSRK